LALFATRIRPVLGRFFSPWFQLSKSGSKKKDQKFHAETRRAVAAAARRRCYTPRAINAAN
jgi:hypothetical protein